VLLKPLAIKVRGFFFFFAALWPPHRVG